jgi:hypothetical protein
MAVDAAAATLEEAGEKLGGEVTSRLGKQARSSSNSSSRTSKRFPGPQTPTAAGIEGSSLAAAIGGTPLKSRKEATAALAADKEHDSTEDRSGLCNLD